MRRVRFGSRFGSVQFGSLLLPCLSACLLARRRRNNVMHFVCTRLDSTTIKVIIERRSDRGVDFGSSDRI
jgi:hypothetical protein